MLFLLSALFVHAQGAPEQAVPSLRHSAIFTNSQAPSPRPVILIHGLGDSASGLRHVAERIESDLSGAYVKSLYIGGHPHADRRSGFIGRLETQVNDMCSGQLASDPALADAPDGIIAIGFSQGGLYARALAQTCRGVRIAMLITLGSPHGGVSALPLCEPAGDPEISAICRLWPRLLNDGAYSAAAQNAVIPAQYYRDPMDEERFRQHAYLARLNNIVNGSAAARNAIADLDIFAMFRWTNDSVVEPPAASWFAFEHNGTVVPLEEQQDLYTDDVLGLRSLADEGRLELRWVEGQHMVFSLDWFSQAIIAPYIALPAREGIRSVSVV